MNTLLKISLITVLMAPFAQAMELPEKPGKKAEKEEKIQVFSRDWQGMPTIGNSSITVENRTDIGYSVEVAWPPYNKQSFFLAPQKSKQVHITGSMDQIQPVVTSVAYVNKPNVTLETTETHFPVLMYLAQDTVIISADPQGIITLKSKAENLSPQQKQALRQELKNIAENKDFTPEEKEFLTINAFKNAKLLD